MEPMERDDLIEDIGEARQEVRRLLLEWEEAKIAAKVAKGGYDRQWSKLDELISELVGDGEPRLPFGKDKPELPWREFELSDIEGFPTTVLVALEETAIKTLGEFVDWMAIHSSLSDLKGVGPAAVEKADDALTKFWSDRQVLAQNPREGTQNPASEAASENPSDLSGTPHDATQVIVSDSEADGQKTIKKSKKGAA